MAVAVQVTTASTAIVAGTNVAPETVTITNLGAASIFVGVGVAATIVGGFPIIAAGSWTFRRPAATAINAIAAVLQVSPADTRVEITLM